MKKLILKWLGINPNKIVDLSEYVTEDQVAFYIRKNVDVVVSRRVDDISTKVFKDSVKSEEFLDSIITRIKAKQL